MELLNPKKFIHYSLIPIKLHDMQLYYLKSAITLLIPKSPDITPNPQNHQYPS